MVVPYVYSIISRRGVIYNTRSDVKSLSTRVYVCNIDEFRSLRVLVLLDGIRGCVGVRIAIML